MNRKRLANKIGNLKLLDRSFNVKENVVKVNLANTLEHELGKFLTFWELRNEGHDIVVEAIFLGGKRADLFDLTTGEAFEIVQSESEESIEKKKLEYPVPVIPIKTSKVLNYWMKQLEVKL